MTRTHGFDDVDIDMLKLCVRYKYADESEMGLQNGLDLLECYFDRWKQVNISKTKAMMFKKVVKIEETCLLQTSMRSWK